MSESERREGRVRIRVEAPPPGGESYRDVEGGALVLERLAGEGPPPQRRAPVVAVIGLVNVALLAFAGYVRSWPAVGAVSAAMVALLWLVLYLGRDRGAADTVRVELGERLVGPDLDAPVEAIREVGVGQGASGSRTVWITLPSGRHLVFESLSDAEARVAADALREAVERRRSRAAPAGAA